MSQVKVQGNASGSGTLTIAAPNTNSDYTQTLPTASGNIVLDSATQTLTNKTLGSGLVAGASLITSGTAVPYTSFTTTTYNDFTSIPSWVKRITVMFNGVSSNGTSGYAVQIGSGGTPVTTGYVGTSGAINSAGTGISNLATSTGFQCVRTSLAAGFYQGQVILTNITGNTWIATWNSASDGGYCFFGSGYLTLGGALNIVRFTAAGDTFDAGSANIFYE